MNSELIDISPVRKELKIEIPAELVQVTHERISREYARQATIPGFRQGRAPLTVIRRRFKEEIASDTIRELVPEAYEEALTQHDLNPLSEPDIHLENAEGLKESGVAPITLHARIEVLPKVEVEQYKGFELIRRVRPVQEEQIDLIINRWRDEGASLFPVENHPAETGDTVNISLQGHFINGTEDDEDFALEETDIEIGHEKTLPEFTECLLGAQVDDARQCVVSYANDFETESLAGKEIEYTLTVNEIYRKELPDLDDAWAQSLDDGYESLADMRAKIRAGEEEGARHESESRLHSQALSKFIDAHNFEVPRTLVAMQSERLLNNAATNFAQMGFDPNRLDRTFWQGLVRSMQPQAERDVRGALLLARLAEIEGLEVTDDDVEAEIQAIAERTGLAVEEIGAELLKDNGEESIKSNLRSDKAIKLILEHARVTDGEWIEPSQEAVANTDAADAAENEAGFAAEPENETEQATAQGQSEAAASSEA